MAYLIPGLDVAPSLDADRHVGPRGKGKERRDNEKEERLWQNEGERLRVIVKITGVTHCALDYFCHKVWKYNPKGCGRYMRQEAGAPREPWAPAKNEENTRKRILEHAPIYQYLMVTSNVRSEILRARETKEMLTRKILLEARFKSDKLYFSLSSYHLTVIIFF